MARPFRSYLVSLKSIDLLNCMGFSDSPELTKMAITHLALVRATFCPAYCHYHGNNQEPHAGWAYIAREEARLLSIARRNLLTQDAVEEMIPRDVEEQMERVEIGDDVDEVKAE
ncbi:hypothetical protein GQ600_19738 [Phytophthora cactorum]|nr:hypothetical protein GQ600_19738 [Phytophthora cactorum]